MADEKPSVRGSVSKYLPEHCQSIIEDAAIGKGIAARAMAIGVSERTYLRWIDPDAPEFQPEFAEAHVVAESLCKAWWEELSRVHAIEEKDGPRLNSQNYRLNMMNRFGWGENNRNHNTNENIDVTISKPQAPKE